MKEHLQPRTLSLTFVAILVAAEGNVQSNRSLVLTLVAILVAAEGNVQSNRSLVLTLVAILVAAKGNVQSNRSLNICIRGKILISDALPRWKIGHILVGAAITADDAARRRKVAVAKAFIFRMVLQNLCSIV